MSTAAEKTKTPPPLPKYQRKKIMAKLAVLSLLEAKEELVSQYTQGRTIHLSEMTLYEGRELHTWLTSQLGTGATQSEQAAKLDRMRKKVLSTCYQLGWTYTKDGQERVDWHSLQAWLSKYTTRKSPDLNDYSITELSHILNALQKQL